MSRVTNDPRRPGPGGDGTASGTACAAPGRPILAEVLVAVREVQRDREPSVVFAAVTQLCGRLFGGQVRVSLVEDGGGAYHLSTEGDGTPVTAAPADEGEILEILAARHESGEDTAVLPIVPPPLEGAPSYRGRLVLRLRRRPDAADTALAQVVVDHAVGRVHSARLSDQLAQWRERAANLEVALESNREIGAAIGILMARHAITSEHAFHLLRRASQLAHRKLRDIADDVVLTGCLPGAPSPHPA